MITEAPGDPAATENSISSGRPLRSWAVVLIWWLVPVAVAICLSGAVYAALTERRLAGANDATGELLAGHSAGQSFVSRYADLSGVRLQLGTYTQVDGPAKATLVLHL